MSTPTGNCIRRRSDGEIIAMARDPDQLIHLEGNLYFHPDSVRIELLEITDRLYNCRHKGICNWVDMRVGGLFLNDVAWVYPDPKPAFRNIAGWYGFFPEHKGYIIDHCETS